jgi:hypothetical protein
MNDDDILTETGAGAELVRSGARAKPAATWTQPIRELLAADPLQIQRTATIDITDD